MMYHMVVFFFAFEVVVVAHIRLEKVVVEDYHEISNSSKGMMGR